MEILKNEIFNYAKAHQIFMNPKMYNSVLKNQGCMRPRKETYGCIASGARLELLRP